MDFLTNFAAGTATNVTGKTIGYAKRHTTTGHIKKGYGTVLAAMDTLEDRQEYLSEDQRRLFAERLDLLDKNRRELADKIKTAKWPWSFLGKAKEFEMDAVLLKDDVVSTSFTAMVKRFSSGESEVKDPDTTKETLNSLKEAILLLREDKMAATGNSARNDKPVVDNDLSLTPTNGSFMLSTSESDDQTTPTDSVFQSGITMTTDSVPFPDCSSSVMTADFSDLSSTMTADSATPLIPPAVPPPVVQSNQGRGLFGISARRNAKETFAMKNVKGTT